jgi:hypothetical protein
MKHIPLSLPELAMVVGTRAAAGLGIGLLVSDFLPREQRRTLGWSLLALGLVTTVPLAADVIGKFLAAPAKDD